MSLTLHEIDRKWYADHEKDTHRDNEHGDLVSAVTQSTLGHFRGSSDAIDDREMRRTRQGDWVKVFGMTHFWADHVARDINGDCVDIWHAFLRRNWKWNVRIHGDIWRVRTNFVSVLFLFDVRINWFFVVMNSGEIFQISGC